MGGDGLGVSVEERLRRKLWTVVNVEQVGNAAVRRRCFRALRKVTQTRIKRRELNDRAWFHWAERAAAKAFVGWDAYVCAVLRARRLQTRSILRRMLFKWKDAANKQVAARRQLVDFWYFKEQRHVQTVLSAWHRETVNARLLREQAARGKYRWSLLRLGWNLLRPRSLQLVQDQTRYHRLYTAFCDWRLAAQRSKRYDRLVTRASLSVTTHIRRNSVASRW